MSCFLSSLVDKLVLRDSLEDSLLPFLLGLALGECARYALLFMIGRQGNSLICDVILLIKWRSYLIPMILRLAVRLGVFLVDKARGKARFGLLCIH